MGGADWYTILIFWDLYNQRSIGLSLKIHGILTLPRTPGYANGPRSVTQKPRGCEGPPEALTEKSGGWERPPEALPKKLDDRDLATSITYTTYYCPLLLIIDYCYLELCTTTLHYYLSLIIITLSLIHYDKGNNTRRNQTDICNWPLLYPLPKSILQKASTSIYRASKERDTLRQRQCFENLRKKCHHIAVIQRKIKAIRAR